MRACGVVLGVFCASSASAESCGNLTCNPDAYCTAEGDEYSCHCNLGFHGDGVDCIQLSSDRRKHFLFAGQSNMEGHVVSSRFRKLMDLLLESTNANPHERIHEDIIEVLQQGPGTVSPYETLLEEADYLISLRDLGLLQSILEPSQNIDCSFFRGNITRAMNAPLSPFSNCGLPFGAELMFGHTLRDFYPRLDFSIVKVAVGGTELAKDWLKRERGTYWHSLAERIREIDDFSRNSWDAFVWWQGENDAVMGMDGATYLEDLREFVANVRQEIYLADKGYGSPKEVPVVIIQIGQWAQGQQTGSEIAQAQMDFVATDKNAFMVETDLFSWDYHHDAATQLIVGDQVALAMHRAGLLKRTPS